MGIKIGLFRATLIMLALLFITGGILPSVGVAAAEVVKIEKTYDIAVAYDNSGSMYDNDDRWCKAKFAMEIFASMLDYKNGDKLTVFPMWDVVTDGSRPGRPSNYTLSTSPIEIRSIGDINKITNMYTPLPGDTPVSVITQAADYLKKSSASEKWLIVLTDGDFIDDYKRPNIDDPDRNKVIPNSETKNRLLAIADEGINVQYFMVGSPEDAQNKDKISSVPSRNFYSEYAETSQELQEKLIGICNKIFQRDELVGKYSGKTLKLDISMKSIIVFVQGQGAVINSLTDKNGNGIIPIADSGQRKFSEYSMDGYVFMTADGSVAKPVPDETLYGQVVTFGNCSVGAYTLDIEGADPDKIKIFYEPDVDMQVDVYDKDGQVVDVQKAAINQGKYIVKAKLVDAKTGADITKSELMGGNVKFDLKITYDGKDPQNYPIDLEQGAAIDLVPGDKIDTVVTGTYLEDYRISNDDDPSIFPGNIVVIDPEDGIKIDAKVLQDDSWYQLSKNKEWEPVRVDVRIDGEPVPDEKLKAMTFEIKAESGSKNKNGDSLKYHVEYVEGESAIEIHLGKGEDGKYVAPQIGKYKMTVKASALANTGYSISGSDKVSFDIRPLSRLVCWIINISIILIVALLIFLYMNMRVLPKEIVLDNTTFTQNRRAVAGIRATVRYTKNGRKGSLSVATPPSVAGENSCNASFTLEAIDKRFVKSKDRRVRVTGISSGNNAVVLNHYTYEKDKKTGKIIDPLVPAAPDGSRKPIRKDIKIASVEIQNPASNLSCTFKHK